MHGSFEFVIVAVITQNNIGLVKPLSLESQKSSCNVLQAQTGSYRMKIVISKQTTEAVYQRARAIAETVNVIL